MVGTDERRGWVGRLEDRIGAPTSKVSDTEVLTETLRTGFFGVGRSNINAT
jgi:hypothetical protein